MNQGNETRTAAATAKSDLLLTVAICTRNRVGFLEKAVKTVLDQIQPGVELLIVDNGSTDATPQFSQELASKCGTVRYYREDELGLSAARNASLRHARGEFVLFLDDDAKAEPGWIKTYVDFFKSPPNGKIGCAGGPVFPDFEMPPPPWLGPGWNTLNEGDAVHEMKTGAGPWGGNAAYNKTATLAIGAFNTNLGRKGKFAGAFEESDMNKRLRDAGWQLWWLPSASILHFMPARRVKFSVLCRDFFDAGRSKAVVRLASMPSAIQRGGFRLGRGIVQPLQAAFTAVAAGFAFVFGARRKAANLFLKSARCVGYGYQLLQF